MWPVTHNHKLVSNFCYGKVYTIWSYTYDIERGSGNAASAREHAIGHSTVPFLWLQRKARARSRQHKPRQRLHHPSAGGDETTTRTTFDCGIARGDSCAGKRAIFRWVLDTCWRAGIRFRCICSSFLSWKQYTEWKIWYVPVGTNVPSMTEPRR